MVCLHPDGQFRRLRLPSLPPSRSAHLRANARASANAAPLLQAAVLSDNHWYALRTNIYADVALQLNFPPLDAEVGHEVPSQWVGMAALHLFIGADAVVWNATGYAQRAIASPVRQSRTKRKRLRLWLTLCRSGKQHHLPLVLLADGGPKPRRHLPAHIAGRAALSRSRAKHGRHLRRDDLTSSISVTGGLYLHRLHRARRRIRRLLARRPPRAWCTQRLLHCLGAGRLPLSQPGLARGGRAGLAEHQHRRPHLWGQPSSLWAGRVPHQANGVDAGVVGCAVRAPRACVRGIRPRVVAARLMKGSSLE